LLEEQSDHESLKILTLGSAARCLAPFNAGFPEAVVGERTKDSKSRR
jgi:hypothetical protein